MSDDMFREMMDSSYIASLEQTIAKLREIKQTPTEMYVCEIDHLILHANQPYIFRVHPHCDKCKAYNGKV